MVLGTSLFGHAWDTGICNVGQYAVDIIRLKLKLELCSLVDKLSFSPDICLNGHL